MWPKRSATSRAARWSTAPRLAATASCRFPSGRPASVWTPWRPTSAPCSTSCSASSRPPPRASTSRRSRCRPPWGPACASTPTGCDRRRWPPPANLLSPTNQSLLVVDLRFPPRTMALGPPDEADLLAHQGVRAKRGPCTVKEVSMENPRPEKVAVVTEVRQRFEAADAALLTEYRGLNVKALADLRRQLRPSGGEYKVYKNTLVRFAARDLGAGELESLLTGPTAIAFVRGDTAAVAKSLRDFARTNPNLVAKGGLLGTKVLSAADLQGLAALPPRGVLLARLAGPFRAPLSAFAGLLAAGPRNLAYGLKALIEKGGATGASPAADATASETEAPGADATAAADADAAPAD